MLDTDYLIIGAGLSGLTCAHLLGLAGKSVRVLEARAQCGGRIRSAGTGESNQLVGDLGPTWVWPKYQPVVQRWIEQLELPTFDQYDQGQTLIDSGPGISVQRYPVPGQDGSVRFVGGTTAIIDALASRLPASAVEFNASVNAVTANEDAIEVFTDNSRYRCTRLICAVPPRIATQISWQPALPDALNSIMAATPTWMAPQAKVVAAYAEPFWRAQGLSGRLMSRTGPIGEAHDHCSPDATVAAIFGFVAWSATQRKEHRDQLITLIGDQLERCYGRAPEQIYLQDWASEVTVATAQDLAGPIEHPSVRPNLLRTALADGRIRFAVAEASVLSPGLIEGALHSAEQTVEAFLGEA